MSNTQTNQKSVRTSFEPLVRFTGKVAVVPGPNTDTDQIIPGRFLKKNRALGYGQYLFHDARFDEQGGARPHPLNAPETDKPTVLFVDDNFGCGSSREGAVYALVDYGVKVVVGTTFGDIFYNNCFKNGVLPIRLAAADHARIAQALQGQGDRAELTVDLETCSLVCAGQSASFEVDEFWRECLMKGLDELSLTLSYEPQVAAFETQYQQTFPWLTRRA